MWCRDLERRIGFPSNQSVVGEVTFHTDTPPSGTALSFDPHAVSGLGDYYAFTTFWNGEEGLRAVLPAN